MGQTIAFTQIYLGKWVSKTIDGLSEDKSARLHDWLIKVQWPVFGQH